MLFNAPEVQLLRAYLTVLVSERAGKRDERGASDLASQVITTALIAAAAITIAGIIVAKFTGKAESIPTE